MKKVLAALAVAGCLAGPAVAQDKKIPATPITPQPKKEPPPKPEPTLKVGDAAPKVKATKWLQGKPVTEFATGQVYVVEFWATWCGPCIVMMPHMADLQHEYKGAGVTFIGYSAKDANNPAEKVAAFVEKRGPKLGYTFAYADDRDTYEAWMKASGQGGIPCSFVVGKDGKIAFIGHPMYLDVVLPKVVNGSWAKADVEAVDAIEKEVDDVFKAIGGPNAEAGLKALADFEAKHPKLAGIPYFNGPRLAAMLKLKKYGEVKAAAGQLADKAAKQADPIALRTVSMVMRSPAAKDQKDLLALSVKAADELLKVNGDSDLAALMNASEAYTAAGNADKAKGFAKKAVPLAEKEVKDDKDAFGLLRLADAYLAAGDKGKAKETAEKALENAPANFKRSVEAQVKKYGVEAKKDDK